MTDLVATQELKNQIWSLESNFTKVNKELDFSKESLFAWQQLVKTDYALKCAQNDREAVKFAVMNVAAIGLTLNPAQAMAYLVPRGGKICLDISYRGLVKLATDTGSIKAVNAQLVYKNDSFEYLGPFEAPKHSANYFGDRGELVGVYVVAKLGDGTTIADTPMSIDEVYRIRDRTEAWKAFTSGRSKSCPWSTDEGEMIKKTAIKRASKMWPKTEVLSNAVAVINEHEGIDFEKEKGEPAKVEVSKYVNDANELYDQIIKICDEKTSGMTLVQKAAFIEDKLGVEKIDDLKKAAPAFLIKTLNELQGIVEVKKEEDNTAPASEETEEAIFNRLSAIK